MGRKDFGQNETVNGNGLEQFDLHTHLHNCFCPLHRSYLNLMQDDKMSTNKDGGNDSDDFM